MTAPRIGYPPFPWTLKWKDNFGYIEAADGRKIASLLGSQEQREFVGELICRMVNKSSES
jgi:hypothetical protein